MGEGFGKLSSNQLPKERKIIASPHLPLTQDDWLNAGIEQNGLYQ